MKLCSIRRRTQPATLQRRRARTAAFTLVDVVGGMAMLGLVSASIIYGLNQLNHFSMVNRLYTAAQTVAQNQIDLILTMGPYDPAQGKYPLPENCGIASATNTILQTHAPYYYDGTRTTTCPMSPNANDRKVTLYRDPMSPATASPIEATVKTVITDTGVTVPVGGVPTPLDLRRATVTVEYTFRNKPYSVVMETMRTSDQ